MQHYASTWESVNSRPVPAWFADAKFGIFIHWGLYSVPAFSRRGCYAEWYQYQLQDQKMAEVVEFHNRVYGERFRYEAFAEQFHAELFDAGEWVRLFERAGARYLNLTSKHHDGFCLYPTAYAPGWNSVERGPKRDLCGELRQACEGSPVRFGLYHSLYEWYHPLYRADPERYALEHLHPMLKELVERYQPATLFTDGEWEQPSAVWHAPEFLQWLYNDSSVRDFIVPNDRWGEETRRLLLGGNATTEYGSLELHPADFDYPKPFEECRGIGKSFGFNRAEPPEDYRSAAELIELLVELCSRGGNLLLNVGPAADGTIPSLQQERLLQMGRWLEINGEGIYGSRKLGSSGQPGIWYTQKDGNVYVFLRRFPSGLVALPSLPYQPHWQPCLLGFRGEGNPVRVLNDDGGMVLQFSHLTPEALEGEWVYVVRLGKGAGA